MRRVARIALAVSATTMLVAALATAGAQAEKERRAGEWSGSLTENGGAAPQRQRMAPKPDRYGYFQSGQVFTVASAIAHRPPVPAAASAKSGDARMEGAELALVAGAAVKAARFRSSAEPAACTRDRSLSRRPDRSDGGRRAPDTAAELSFDRQAACSPERHVAEGSRTRGAMEVMPELLQADRPAPAPVVIKFEAIVINISFNGLGG